MAGGDLLDLKSKFQPSGNSLILTTDGHPVCRDRSRFFAVSGQNETSPYALTFRGLVKVK